ncbi:MAG: type IV pilus secretin PilQ [Gammaproteobacteria bacterium]
MLSIKGFLKYAATAYLLLFSVLAFSAAHEKAATNTLKSVQFTALSGDRVQIVLTLENGAFTPSSFTTDNPARIALDFPNTTSAVDKRSQTIGVGMARSVNVVEAMGRTRVVVNLVALVPYTTSVQGNDVILTLASAGSVASAGSGGRVGASTSMTSESGPRSRAIEDIDFRRGENGEGRVEITLGDPATVVDMRSEGGQVVLDFLDATLPENLERRLDVTDFATPVKTIDTFARAGRVHMVITPLAEYDHFAYQSNNLFTVEFRPLTKAEVEEIKKEKFGYTGERLSLNFQDIEVRSVLQLIADFTGLNLVASDTVSGNITLRLNNVPWDQALDIVLKTKGLGKRQEGNVLLIAPSEEIAAREKLELESQKQIEELAPLRSEFLQVNYAKASEIAELLKSEKNSLLSERGAVTIDTRTNTLLIQDTAERLADIRRIVARLDIPVRQVLIETRVVTANNDFAKELGVEFGLSRNTTSNNNNVWFGGQLQGDTNFGSGTAFVDPDSGNEKLMVGLPISDPAGSFALAIGQIGSTLLQLELQALQAEGRGEVISAPRVITSDQHEALIEQGVEIPYQEASSSGATTVSFKKAVLSLRVTPHITPDDRVIMDLVVNKDNPDFSRSVLGVPPVDTREINTRVLVDNGETVVLGGVFEQVKTQNIRKVPGLGSLPIVGWMFRSETEENDKNELLIFVTPKILKESLSAR